MTAQAPVLREHGNAYNIFILVLTIFSLAIMVLLLLPITPAERDLLTLYDNAVCVIFLIDFAVNLAGSKPKRAYFIGARGWLDLLGSIPSFGFIPFTALFRLARLSRLARIGKLLGGQAGKDLVVDVLRNRGQYATFITILLAGIVLSVGSILVLEFESRSPGANIQSGGDAIWWGLVTITTVGYGDFYPTTLMGRLTGIFVMFAGIGIIGALASILASLLVSPSTPEEPAADAEPKAGAGRPRLNPRPWLSEPTRRRPARSSRSWRACGPRSPRSGRRSPPTCADRRSFDRAHLMEVSGAEPVRARIRQAVVRHVPILAWLPAYPSDWRRADLVASVTSWGVMVPVAMAYAALAGVPPEYGLITAFAALAAYAVFGTSRHLKVTTSSTMAIMSASVVAPLAGGDADRYLALTAGLALVVGGILLAAGLVRLGFIADFLAKSVVTGFIFGLAITIIIGQLPKLLGVPGGGGSTIGQLQTLIGNLPDTNPWTLAVGGGALALILVLRAISRKIPGPLVALVLGILAVSAFDLTVHGVSVVGEIETGIPLPGIPNISLLDIPFLAAGAAGIVFLAVGESLGAARAFAARHRYEIDADQELVALGAANLSTGLFGGFTVDASLSQSATAEAAGTRSQLSSIVTAGLILATAVLLAPLFKNLPNAVLGAIVIAAVLGLMDVAELRRYAATRRTDFLLAMVALVAVVTTTVLIGLVIAVLLSLMFVLYRASRPVRGQAGQAQRRTRDVRRPGASPRGRGHPRAPDAAHRRPALLLQRQRRQERPPRGRRRQRPQAIGSPSRHRRDGRLRRDHGGHRPAADHRAARSIDRGDPGPGQGTGPRPDAEDGHDGPDRGRPRVPLRRGRGRGLPSPLRVSLPEGRERPVNARRLRCRSERASLAAPRLGGRDCRVTGVAPRRPALTGETAVSRRRGSGLGARAGHPRARSPARSSGRS